MGSYCWKLKCADFLGPPKPRCCVVIPIGARLVVRGPGVVAQASIGVLERTDGGGATFDPVRQVWLKDGRDRLRAPEGIYVLDLFTDWDQGGDAEITLGIELRPSEL